jgi:RNA polymerase sigma-70 factor, ECF subfamily
MSSTTDEARAALVLLMQRVGRGDRAAFRPLYDATSAKLYGIIIRILRDPDQSRDVLQEVYVRIFERASEFNATVASPITWMAAVARNRALDEVRRVRPIMVDTDEDFDPPAETGHPLDGRERSEELQRLMDCLSALDAEKRQMVMLAYYKGASRDALSQRFARPVATVKTVLHRSLAQLRECLQQ